MLPLDIILSEILPKLPARSLVRFKCVCKSFETLISSPKFIDIHLRNSATNENRLLIFNTGGRRGRIQCMDLDLFWSPKFSFLLIRPIYHTVGSCNGLVLIKVNFVAYPGFGSNALFKLMLFNPCTGESLYIPGIYPEEIHSFEFGFGFGYDSSTQDYKIVRLINKDFLLKALVYSLKANSWKVVDVNNNALSKHGREFGVLINNHLLHWKFYSFEMKSNRICCFDLKTEKWVKDVPLPDYRGDKDVILSSPMDQENRYLLEALRNDVKELGVLDGCLCVLTKNPKEYFVDVWVMKEYGIKESWVKILGVSDLIITKSLKYCPLAYRGIEKNEILVVMEEYDERAVTINAEILWYNIRDKTYAKAHLIDNIPKSDYIDAFICHGSLVTLPLDDNELRNWSNDDQS